MYFMATSGLEGNEHWLKLNGVIDARRGNFVSARSMRNEIEQLAANGVQLHFLQFFMTCNIRKKI